MCAARSEEAIAALGAVLNVLRVIELQFGRTRQVSRRDQESGREFASGGGAMTSPPGPLRVVN